MINTRNSRLCAPIAVVVIGSGIAGATAIGHTWVDALITETVTLALAFGYFLLTGSDSDIGAIYGRRSDERQTTVRLQAARFAFVVMIGAAFVCAVISIALNETYWQADVIGSVGGVAFVASIMHRGVRDEHGPREYHGIMASKNMSEPAMSDEQAEE
jgi:peptidoglycan/LPS O-acetylase OafA/YrhL